MSWHDETENAWRQSVGERLAAIEIKLDTLAKLLAQVLEDLRRVAGKGAAKRSPGAQ